ncbi:MAG: carboxylesterase family protein [Bryobacteraceae bacterium]
MSNRDGMKLTRRTALSSAAAGWAWANEQGPVADTEHGRVRGATVRGVHLFRGIPYGGPTEGAGRFLPPAKAEKWVGVRDGTVTGARCVQGPGNIFMSPLIGEYFAGGRPDRVELSRQVDSENCLVLNVLTPALRGKRPVMVYTHGGGFTGGSSALTLFSDQFVREQDVVLVGVNHRLNVFGYSYLGALSKKYAQGNVGQLDLVAALQWIRSNIGHFGGDAANVTIFGESGGGAKISALMAMPAAKGLFHKASVQSGSLLRAMPGEEADAAARKLLAALGLSAGQADELQKIPADRLFAASKGLTFGAVVDGTTIPEQTWDPKAPEVSATVPMMIGNDKDESSLFSLKDEELFGLDNAALERRLVAAGIPEGEVGKLLAVYRRDHPSESPSDLYFRISTDRGARYNAVRQAERKLAQGKASVHMWYCQWNTPLGDGKFRIRSFHTCDLPLAMRLVRFPEAEQLSRQLSAAWAAFARTGNPGTKALPWPAYTMDRRSTMIFDGDKSGAVDDPDKEERVLLRERPSGKPL